MSEHESGNPPVPPHGPAAPPPAPPWAGQPVQPWPGAQPVAGPPVQPGYPGQFGAPGQAPYSGQAGPFAAPHVAPAPGALPPPASASRGRGWGIVALVAALAALVIAAVVGGTAGFTVGIGIGHEMATRPISSDLDLSYLTPVRDAVLWVEVAFWTGTALGLWGLIQGIVAVVGNRGRGAGIGAIVVAVLGPFVFASVLYGVVVAGIAAGSSIGG